ncbi:MAG: hypothetical protein ABJA82_11905, partial [Myxococcales bacterium]
MMTQVPPRLNVGESEESQPERDDGQRPSEQTPHIAAGDIAEDIAEDSDDKSGDETQDRDAHRADDAADTLHAALDERTPHDAPAPVDSAAVDASGIEGAPAAESNPGAEAADDSLDSILLAVGAQPLQRSANASSAGEPTTLMAGDDHAAQNLDSDENEQTETGDEARRLDAIAADLRAASVKAASVKAASVEDGPGSDVDFGGAGGGERRETKQEANTPALIESKLTSQPPADEPQTASLLDDVAQALNVQAAEYRDRARGRLPGMPGTPSAAPGNLAEPSSDAEFEDPEESEDGEIAALTPGIISVEEDTGAVAFQSSQGNEGDPAQEVTQKVASGSLSAVQAPPAGSGASLKGMERGDSSDVGESSGLDIRSADRGDTRVDNRPTVKVPPVPGISLGATSPSVGPPPGVSRPTTPVSGLSLSSLGRMRLPTPAPGSAVGLPPPSGRITLPPGTMAPLPSARVRGDLSDTMPATPFSIEASRRNTAGMPIGSGSGRVSTRGTSRVTEPVIHRPTPSSFAVLLTAHVKLATLNLAGLIALTFAGGLLVGMLVWRGQGRGEQPAGSRSLTTAASPSTEPKSDFKADLKIEPKTTAAGESNLAPSPTVGAVPAPAAPAAAAGAAAAALAVTRADRGHAAKETVVAPPPSSTAPAAGPLGLQAAAAAPVRKSQPATAARAAARPHPPAALSGGRATTTATASVTQPPPAASAPGAGPATAKTATAAATATTAPTPKAPALRTAALTASKPMATNASGKPG